MLLENTRNRDNGKLYDSNTEKRDTASRNVVFITTSLLNSSAQQRICTVSELKRQYSCTSCQGSVMIRLKSNQYIATHYANSDTDTHTSVVQSVASLPLPVSFLLPPSSVFPPPRAFVSLPPVFVAPSPPPPVAGAPPLLSCGR